MSACELFNFEFWQRDTFATYAHADLINQSKYTTQLCGERKGAWLWPWDGLRAIAPRPETTRNLGRAVDLISQLFLQRILY